jgi:hypothetical protein
MYKSARAKVAYALLGFGEGQIAPKDWGEALRISLRPGTTVERYGRRWFMAQWRESSSGPWIEGRLAFESTSEASDIWDDERNDVRPIESLGMPVQVVPFVIDVENGRVAFELRTNVVRPGTFQGNFQALLVTASGLPWRVTLEGVRQPPWEEWERSVERLTKVWITMHRPNPHSPMKELEELFDRGVKSAQVIAMGDDIDFDGAELLAAAFAHARDYGRVSAEGVVEADDETRTEQWKSEEEAGVRKDQAYRAPPGHVPPEELERLLEERSRERPQNGEVQ